ncbi:MAG: hypothetical protein IJX76_02675 [Clostridia bacterium]|nr:hypothetical protein [Clostridia bacterium]
MNRELNEEQAVFYRQIQEYLDAGIIREVYSTEEYTLVCLGELIYAIMPYSMLNGEPIAIFVNEDAIRRIAKSTLSYFNILKGVYSNPDRYGSMIYDMSSKKLEFWKNWVIEAPSLMESKRDLDLEKEVLQLVQQPEKKPGFFERLLGKKSE